MEQTSGGLRLWVPAASSHRAGLLASAFCSPDDGPQPQLPLDELGHLKRKEKTERKKTQ